MKAIVIEAFGSPDVLKMETVDRPKPADDEILVKVYASGVNPTDCIMRQGGNDILRPFLKLPLILGYDMAGIVETVGREVTDFKPGDRVFGVPNFPGNGSYAEYCAAKAIQFAAMPKNSTFNEAAGISLAGLTAWTALFEHAKLQSGQRVLILGASGGVGSFAVQFAKAKGAYVAAVASSKNRDYLKALGADEVMDYETQNFGELIQDLDVVIEASAPRDDAPRLNAVKVLKKGGKLVSVNIDLPYSDKVMKAFKDKNIIGELSANQPKREFLVEIANLIQEGKVKVSLNKVFPLEEIADAHRESESWHTRGKLVLEIRKESTGDKTI